MSNPWKARRVNFEECEGWGWWQIYCRNVSENGTVMGTLLVMDFNLATETDEVPDLVQEVLDAHNSKLENVNA